MRSGENTSATPLTKRRGERDEKGPQRNKQGRKSVLLRTIAINSLPLAKNYGEVARLLGKVQAGHGAILE